MSCVVFDVEKKQKNNFNILVDDHNMFLGYSESKTFSDIYEYKTDVCTVLLHGEVYSCNGDKIIKSDFCKTIVNKNSESLKDFLALIDGYFNVYIYDKKIKQLKVCTDRYGMKPVYIKEEDKILAMTSNPLAVMEVDAEDIDPYAVKMFIEIGHNIGEKTIYKNIKEADLLVFTTLT